MTRASRFSSKSLSAPSHTGEAGNWSKCGRSASTNSLELSEGTSEGKWSMAITSTCGATRTAGLSKSVICRE